MGLGPALDVAGPLGVGFEAARVLDGVVVQAGEPGGVGAGDRSSMSPSASDSPSSASPSAW